MLCSTESWITVAAQHTYFNNCYQKKFFIPKQHNLSVVYYHREVRTRDRHVKWEAKHMLQPDVFARIN